MFTMKGVIIIYNRLYTYHGLIRFNGFTDTHIWYGVFQCKSIHIIISLLSLMYTHTLNMKFNHILEFKVKFFYKKVLTFFKMCYYELDYI